MPRIFFAIDLPEKVRENLAQLQLKIPHDPGAVKLVEKDNFHLTLLFCGEVTEANLVRQLRQAAAVAKSFPPFTAGIGGVGVFPSPARPRVFWAGIREGREDIIRLAAALSRTLGVAPGQHYSPHLTLGRVRQGKRASSGNFLEQTDFFAGAFAVDRFFCLESTLTRRGPVYQKRETFMLGGREAKQ
ncbi:MAG TPA: RNA 2',3'-cyclic phosphodiesterase [Firmicutes bacterium]|nr:RNA 2',3'-cyclic phosphodiesterase [Bacillota bacterium]